MTDQQDPDKPTGESRLWMVKEVAGFLNLSEAYIYELAKRGTILRGKIGRVYRFEREELLAWWKLRKRA